MKYFLAYFLISVYLISFCQDQYIFQSDYLNEPDTVWVFTPDNYSVKEDIPAIYMLHGWSGKYYHWDLMIDCQKYANTYHTIIVCPDGLYDSWYLDSPVKNENQYKSFFVEELVPKIESEYSINHDSIFITGLSMGGHGALYLFALMPQYFASAGSLSGLLYLTNWTKHYGISRVLGIVDNADNEEILVQNSVIGNIEKLMAVDKPIIVSCGTEDPFYKINIDFIDSCNAIGIKNTFIESTGGHDAAYWRSRVVDHFQFFFRK
jgi:putative tributyrin esterase